MASGARSAPVGQATAPRSTRTWRNIPSSTSGSKTVPWMAELPRNRFMSTWPDVPSTNRTCNRRPGIASTLSTRQGVEGLGWGTTPAVGSVSAASVDGIGSSSPKDRPGDRLPTRALGRGHEPFHPGCRPALTSRQPGYDNDCQLLVEVLRQDQLLYLLDVLSFVVPFEGVTALFVALPSGGGTASLVAPGQGLFAAGARHLADHFGDLLQQRPVERQSVGRQLRRLALFIQEVAAPGEKNSRGGHREDHYPFSAHCAPPFFAAAQGRNRPPRPAESR